MDKRDYNRFIGSLMWTIILFFMLIILSATCCFTLSGCTTTKYVPVESVTHDSIYISQLQRDSIHVHDSTYLFVETKSDTVYQTKYVQKIIYRDVLRTDTQYIDRIDTIRVPVPASCDPPKWYKSHYIPKSVAVIFLIMQLSAILFFIYLGRKYCNH